MLCWTQPSGIAGMDARSPRNAFAFYAIALALAVAVRLAVPVVGHASLALTMLTPALAVAIMLALVSPEGGLRDAARNLGLTTAGLKGWPLAIAGPALIQAAGLAILVAAGLTTLAAPEIRGSVAGDRPQHHGRLRASAPPSPSARRSAGAATCCRGCSDGAWSRRC